MYVQPKFIPVNVLSIQITTSIPPHRREIFVNGDGNYFYRDVARWKKIFVLPLFSSNSLEEKRQITESPAGTVGIYLLVHRSSDPFVPTHPRRVKRV